MAQLGTLTAVLARYHAPDCTCPGRKKEARSSGFKKLSVLNRDRCLCLLDAYLGRAFQA
jgi:hypothetical protein